MGLISKIFPTSLKGIKLSPELLLIFPLAFMGDSIGFILLLLGLDDAGIIDFVVGNIIMLWIILRRKHPSVFKRILLRFFGFAIIECVPYVGGIFFGYTLAVLKTIMDSNEAQQEEDEENQIAALGGFKK